MTQVYIEQAQIIVRQKDYPFNINGQYRDITHGSKGVSDFYFYANEQNVSTTSLYSVECKRFPAPAKHREREYVVGNNKNGGIERYKIEKHGKGLNECGLVGFIEQENSAYWLKKVNSWISELSETTDNWKKEEFLQLSESKADFDLLNSIANRDRKPINLTHLWINAV